MDVRGWFAPALIVATALAIGGSGGCEADLEDDCTSGPCGSGTVASGTSVGATVGGSGEGGGASCLFPDTGEIPCDVFTILDARCHKCHQDPPLNFAPFPLLTWDDFQAEYGVTTVWEHAENAIEPGAIPQMPLNEDPLPEEQLVVMRAWFATCHEATGCAKAQNGGSSSSDSTSTGGGGGAGGSGSGGAGGAGGG